MEQFLLLFVIFFPALCALLMPALHTDRAKGTLLVVALAAEALAVAVLLPCKEAELTLFSMTPALTARLRMDAVSRLFMGVAAGGFLFSGIYALRYMGHSERRGSFYSFYLLSLGALMGMDLSANLITMYLFFEMITLLSMPLVLHDRTPAAVRAALKYLFYSIAGAFLALCAIFFLSRYAQTLEFVPGGSLHAAAASGHETLLRVVIFLGVVGFGAKAGMYPLHGWLPDAHPAAPAPASAVLSGIIAKAGVLAIIRVVFFSVGADFVRGTWVQTAWLSLALLTVLMGSMMAFREQQFKKRLAYSSISQISYILVGLFFLTPEAAYGGLLHLLFHAVIKICLFLVAGSFIFNTGKHNVDDFLAYGRSMPITMWSFTLASLALVGIPPASGFVSKWYLAAGALDSQMPVFQWLAPVILLISALLTAGYLLPITIRGFFPGKEAVIPERNNEGGPVMWLPIVILAALTILLGVFSGALAEPFAAMAQSLFG